MEKPKQNGWNFVHSIAPPVSMLFLGGIFTFLGVMWSQGETVRESIQSIKTAAAVLSGKLDVQDEKSRSLDNRVRDIEEELRLKR